MSASSPVTATSEPPVVVREEGQGRRPWTALAGVGYVVLSFAGLALAPLPDLGSGSTAIEQFRAAAHAPAT